MNFQPRSNQLPFVTSLCLSSYKQQLTLASTSRFLNIKSIDEYKEFFISWLMNWCHTKKEILEEFELVNNFEILYVKNKSEKEISRIENKIKKEIKNETIFRLKQKIKLIENM